MNCVARNCLTAVMLLALSGVADAAVVTTQSGTASMGPPVVGTLSVSSSDLAEASVHGTATASATPLFSSSVSEINNGDVWGSGSYFSTLPAYVPGDGDSLTLSLDTTANPLGYDITSVMTMTGFGDRTRTGQKYTVAFRTVGSTAFIDPISVDVPDFSDRSLQELQVTLSPDAGDSLLASGVDALQFTFQPVGGAPATQSVYREIDVFGEPTTDDAAAIPEPASLALLAMGAVGLLARRRKGA